jgi:hypothetical protein
LLIVSLKRRAGASSALGYAETARRGLNGPWRTIVFAKNLGIIFFTRFPSPPNPLPFQRGWVKWGGEEGHRMSFWIQEERSDRRRRRRRGLIRWLLGLSLVGVLGYYGYEAGNMFAESKLDGFDAEIARLEDTIAGLENSLAESRIAFKAERRISREWERRYRENVLDQRMKGMLALVRAKLDAGIDDERLAFLINSAANPRVCDGNAKTKRFLVRTPLFKGANDSVGFHTNTITVTALGESAVNQTGQREGWYDPAKPMTMRFTHIGGEATEKEGKLPLHHSLVAGDDEFRFSAVPGAQGFVKVTGDRCDYP